ncbi:MAG: inositol monophosphatase [Akkermansiaceae bacterium]|nr:inositol monophosphatase [Akkermansiaceae bacterium]
MHITTDTLDTCIDLVRSVGAFQLQHFRKMPDGADSIKAVRETVSFVDVESEKMLQSGLSPLVEGAGFYGEESGKSGSQELVWIVDPLDGTTNYLSGLDQFSISVALVENGEPVLALVYKPTTNEIYSCIKGQGACYNGAITRPSHPAATEVDALFSTGFPYRSPDVAGQFFKAAADILTLGRGIRRSGSAALDVANLSMGWVQGFWETDLQPYDVAAGILLMKENGILVTNQRGEDYDMFSDRLMVAALPNVHAALLATVAKAYDL